MTEFRSGFVAMVGRPNVGKSTLINALVGQKIAAVSPRPQTTRRCQLGILSQPGVQLVFVDTPGIHQPRHKLGEFMNQEARTSLRGVDAIVFVADIASSPTSDDALLASLLPDSKSGPPTILAANKIDLVNAETASAHIERYRELLSPDAETIEVSATRGDGLEALMVALIAKCPIGAPEFDEDQITDLYEREIAADLVREAALLKLRDEVPHGIAVRVNEFKERENGMAYISATILVERESQKPIVIGESGKMLKQIGIMARREIEAMSSRKVFLELRVKVEKGWRNSLGALDRLGYKIKR